MPVEFRMFVRLKEIMRSSAAPERAQVPSMYERFRVRILKVIDDYHLQATLSTAQGTMECVVTGAQRDLHRLMTLICDIATCSEPTPAP
jgi:hypothetical protein